MRNAVAVALAGSSSQARRRIDGQTLGWHTGSYSVS